MCRRSSRSTGVLRGRSAVGVVQVAARGPVRADGEGRRRGGPAALLGDRAARREDAPGELVAGRRQEARDGVQPPVVLALAAAGDAAQQPDRVRVARLVEHLAGRALLDQLPGVQHADPVAHLGDHGQVVADEQHRGVELLAQRRPPGRAPRPRRSRPAPWSARRGSAATARRPAPSRSPPAAPSRRRAGAGSAPSPGAGRRSAPCASMASARSSAACAVQAGDLVHLGDLAADLDRRVQRPPGLLVDHRHRAGAQVAQRRRAHGQRVHAR